MLEAAFYLASAFWLGALHAATPGHGKTVTAAYLVGARGRIVDAITLGVVVTLAHTGGIVAFGILGTLSSSALLPQQAEGYLALATGFLIVVLGLWMLWGQRHDLPWSTASQKRTAADHSEALEAGELTSAVATSSRPLQDAVHHREDRHGADIVLRFGRGGRAHDHGHAHAHNLTAAYRHDGEPPVSARQLHASDVASAVVGDAVAGQSTRAVHGHDHWHGWGHHHHPEPVLDSASDQRPSFGLLLGLGIAGGVLPDPAALAVLLAAIANGTLVLGLMTVLVFSLGFASVLVIVGLIAARASRLVLDRVDRHWASWIQFSTSMLVVLMGVVMTANAFGTLGAYG